MSEFSYFEDYNCRYLLETAKYHNIDIEYLGLGIKFIEHNEQINDVNKDPKI